MYTSRCPAWQPADYDYDVSLMSLRCVNDLIKKVLLLLLLLILVRRGGIVNHPLIAYTYNNISAKKILKSVGVCCMWYISVTFF